MGYEWNCKENARTIRFEGSIVSVPDVAFRLWPNITKVELTESVQCIGYRSFMDCDRLPEVTFYGNTALMPSKAVMHFILLPLTPNTAMLI